MLVQRVCQEPTLGGPLGGQGVPGNGGDSGLSRERADREPVGVVVARRVLHWPGILVGKLLGAGSVQNEVR